MYYTSHELFFNISLLVKHGSESEPLHRRERFTADQDANLAYQRNDEEIGMNSNPYRR
jgi:hypothetical protein